MSEILNIKEYLRSCTNDVSSDCAKGTGLTAIYRSVFNHKKAVLKDKMVADLSEFYADKKNIIDIWESLSECERDFVANIVRCNGKEYSISIIEYAKKHGFKLEYEGRWGNIRSVFEDYHYSSLRFLHLLTRNIPDTRTVLFFPSGKDMPKFIMDVLKTVIEPMKFEYDEYIPNESDYIICRENRYGDFGAIVRFVVSEKLKVKQGTFDISKAKMAKLLETVGFEDVCDRDGKFCAPKETKRNNDFKVAQPLFVLAANSEIVEIDSEGIVSPGKKSTALLSIPYSALMKKLFNDYIKKNKIYEINYITHVNIYDGAWYVDWHECRKPIIDLLKTCPVEKFIQFESFNKNAKIFCADFFRKLLNCAVMVKGFDSTYGTYEKYIPNWDECEVHVIRLILSFLSAMGMVDVAYIENVPRIRYSDKDLCVGIAGFRITKLGAWILGLTNVYEEQEIADTRNVDGGLMVLPDYSIIISGLKCRIEHETYLSQFLTKVSNDENSSVYRLDFQSAIRAFDIGITPKKINSYLKKVSNTPIPDNVKRSLDDWQAKVGRIKISKLTIIETDDPLLLEEIKHIKGISNILIRDLQNAVAITDEQEKKSKQLIEKNGWLVTLD